MIGATFCSGIGAPEVAAPWVDWRFASEIEDFPRAVLQERFGYRADADHNQGDPYLAGDLRDVTPETFRRRGVPLPDLIVAGTPCQAFSLAGARLGLEDPRGNLTLTFVGLVHDLVASRPDGRCVVVWENVPGVLSDSGNAFGCFLGGLVGAVDALSPPGGGSWPGEGMVQGPRSRAAWAVLDAQFFGVAQRRRRVFVVVDFGGACDPAAVLFEPDRLRGDPPARREAGQIVAALTASGAGVGGADVDDAQGGRLIAMAHGQGGAEIAVDGGAPALTRNHEAPIVAFTANDFGQDAAVGLAPTLRAGLAGASHANGGVAPAVAYDVRGREDGAQLEGPHLTANLRAASGGSSRSYVFAPSDVIPLLEIGKRTGAASADKKAGMGVGAPGDPMFSLQAKAEHGVATPWAVRRLMPVECERLQGFPDGHTAILREGKPAADGPRYAGLGNSMAVPVIKWILDRVRASMAAHGIR